MTRPDRRLVKRGVKPICQMDTTRESFYIYGSVDITGGTCLMQEHSKMGSLYFQDFLDAFADQYSKGMHVMVCDGSSIHWSKDLKIPHNLVLLKLPPYCPELNPVERVWQDLKKELKGLCWKSLEELKIQVRSLIALLGFDKLYTLTAWDWILDSQMSS